MAEAEGATCSPPPTASISNRQPATIESPLLATPHQLHGTVDVEAFADMATELLHTQMNRYQGIKVLILVANCVETAVEIAKYYMQAQEKFDYASMLSDSGDEDIQLPSNELSTNLAKLLKKAQEEAADASYSP
ncbi:hypothetical protein M409DRAFT_53517 [Zasmidium cellare ATCC 36951]|uniref:Uncharacterized protein n=1 Tax=Zasmidium cellare ATCC 36951 TaxID=1080233 RepID=A0A6A6CPR4_ZASCE|nr:uncharacterized protein M409DRAFT_53517 [Zasmidium cellare ATCC 36951]KAF2168218.1 hypothetical protein M409DRAFT_53517 [Zasmidium cellare ATCC 36951]